MLTVGWLAVAFGVLAMHWADRGFPFSSAKTLRTDKRVMDVTFPREISVI
jgi:hypothetical protein